MSEDIQVVKTKKKSSKVFISILTIIMVMMLSYVVSVAYSLLLSAKVYDGVVVEGISATGMSKEELLDKLTQKYSTDLSQKNIQISAKNLLENINFEKANVKYHIESSVDKAYGFGRDGNFSNRFLNLFLAKTSTTHIKLDVSYDKEYVKNIVSTLSKKVSLPVKEYEVVYTPAGKATLVTGHHGESIKDEELIGLIDANIRSSKTGKITANIISIQPKEITVDYLFSKINTEAKNASFEINNNKLIIVPHVLGKKVEKSLLTAIVSVAKSKEDIEIPLQVSLVDPPVKSTDIQSKILRDELASYSTQFYTGDKNNDNRKVNIGIAVSKINGTLIAPGNNFSFNQVVGPRTPENGYKDAHAYVGGKVVDSTGGGICQVSTTLYNAALFANFETVERHNHMFTVGYVPKGRDAAVAYGTSDFRFKNNTNWPIKVICWVSPDNKIFFSLKGTDEHPDKSVGYRQQTVSELPPYEEKTNDPTLDEGTTAVTAEGTLGYIVDTFKISKQNGKVISETKIHTSRYEPMPKQVRVGTKKPIPANAQIVPVLPSPLPTPKVKGIDDSYNPPVTVH